MTRRLTTSSHRTWSRIVPSLAAAAILTLGTTRASAQQAQLGAPMPADTLPTIPPPVQGPPLPGQQATTLPPLPNPSPLTPSSLQSRQAATATPKLASQRPEIQTQPKLPPAGTPQPTMLELRQSLRDEGLKNMGMPDFMRQVGAKPPTPPAGMLPATPNEKNWFAFWRSSDTPATMPTTPTTPTTPAAAAAPPPTQTATRTEPPLVQQTGATVPPPEQQSWWYRWTHRTSQPDASAGQQPTGPMVLPEATPLRMQ